MATRASRLLETQHEDCKLRYTLIDRTAVLSRLQESPRWGFKLVVGGGCDVRFNITIATSPFRLNSLIKCVHDSRCEQPFVKIVSSISLFYRDSQSAIDKFHYHTVHRVCDKILI